MTVVTAFIKVLKKLIIYKPYCKTVIIIILLYYAPYFKVFTLKKLMDNN